MFDKPKELIEDAKKIIVIQAENPDGDSLGSALALEEILGDMGKEVSLYCPVDIPRHIRYVKGWDRVVGNFDTSSDLAIIVDTASNILLTKVLAEPGARSFLDSHPVVVIDHHATKPDLEFEHTFLHEEVVSAGEMVFKLAKFTGWKVNQQAAEDILITIMSDSLGLTNDRVIPETFRIVAELAELGAKNSEIEKRRRELMKKPAEILEYKGRLIDRIEYFLDGKLALIHIPWEEIKKYSDKYNPSVLVLDEMRLVEGVALAVAIKTYPDGKLTGKFRANTPVSETVASFFGGGGHQYAAGFRVYEEYDKILPELLSATKKALDEYDSQAS